MNHSSSFRARVLRGTLLAGTLGGLAFAQQPQPVPVTNDTPAATTKPMPPETTPVQGTAGTTTSAAPMTKNQLKAQRKQQKAEEKAANSSAKAAKTNAKAKKQSDKAVQDQEKASPNAAAPPVAPN